MTKIINLFAGPGTGKSTTAAGFFHKAKLAGKRIELVTEFAKQLTYQGRSGTLNNQAYVHAKQLHYLDSVVGQVDYIITDSPTLLSCIYAPEHYPKSFKDFVLDIFHSYENINFFLKRVKAYQKYGRSQTLDEAVTIDNKIWKYLSERNIPCGIIDADEIACDRIFNIVFNQVSDK